MFPLLSFSIPALEYDDCTQGDYITPVGMSLASLAIPRCPGRDFGLARSGLGWILQGSLDAVVEWRGDGRFADHPLGQRNPVDYLQEQLQNEAAITVDEHRAAGLMRG
jgi:hypothetical protein